MIKSVPLNQALVRSIRLDRALRLVWKSAPGWTVSFLLVRILTRKSMKRNIQIEALAQIPLEKQRIEVVERKCIGHPDSIAHGVAEAISRALCTEYLEEFGVVLLHNTD